MYAFFKDRFVDENATLISINDRSFRFGDGIFETLLIRSGKIFDYPSHLDRLKQGLKAFKINYDTGSIEKISYDLIQKNNLDRAYLRIIISRGINSLDSIGYRISDNEPYLIIQAVNKLPSTNSFINLFLSSYRSCFAFPSKTNSSAHYVLATIEAQENFCDNALILNQESKLCETANGNIFWFKGDTLYTPSLDLPLIPGTIRRKILEIYPKHKQGHYHIDELADADEVFMSNIGSIISHVKSIQKSNFIYTQFTYSEALKQQLLKEIYG